MRPKSPFGAMDECGGPPSGRPSVHRRIPVGCYNKMPFELLRRLCAETMPVKLVKKDEIDKLVTLREAGLVAADIPPILPLEGLNAYAGAAIVHSVTPKGRRAAKV